ncbi:universal stress protein [Phenylobacterium sp.]|uniref:universal stress protein n=1 Tax=Phenylobacterium sp. TaxID=1871053 RepID=UPI0027308D4A|nr:universal stress protein [Phenylobacterium sp.]MDP1619119.1 universal stress protein [Phenylobacterium sp.]MDP1987419.1 universal stress protein [Phenylobacterium sp.]
MAFKDVLLHLETYPDPTTDWAADQAVALCAALGDQVTAVAAHATIAVKTNRLADFALNFGELARSEEARSRAAADHLLDRFEASATAAGVYGGRVGPAAEMFEVPDLIARMARTRDVCVVPYARDPGPQQGMAEALIFSSGRPVVIFRPREGAAPMTEIGTALIAWDGGRSAAAALAAALPALQAARKVVVLTILNEKPQATPAVAEDVLRHLARHGIAAEAQTFDSAGATIGSVLEHVVERVGADLLVMGAFGHSRAREFVLGGATRSMLEAPPTAVLLAH